MSDEDGSYANSFSDSEVGSDFSDTSESADQTFAQYGSLRAPIPKSEKDKLSRFDRFEHSDSLADTNEQLKSLFAPQDTKYIDGSAFGLLNDQGRKVYKSAIGDYTTELRRGGRSMRDWEEWHEDMGRLTESEKHLQLHLNELRLQCMRNMSSAGILKASVFYMETDLEKMKRKAAMIADYLGSSQLDPKMKKMIDSQGQEYRDLLIQYHTNKILLRRLENTGVELVKRFYDMAKTSNFGFPTNLM